MKSLIIGAAGFVGEYLIKELVSFNDDVYATKLANENIRTLENIKILDLDILDEDNIKKVIEEVRPDCIYHLAAQSSVALSWKKPKLTAQINIIGSINLLEAVRLYSPNSKILLVGSSEEYGKIDYSVQISENIKSNPQNIYAITKMTVEQIGKIYANAYNLNIFMTRSFNHIGPHQSRQFVVSDFCNQVVDIEKGLQDPIIRVGNLKSKRDFTDVRDIVKAYRIIIEKGQIGEVYNVGSGESISIEEILNIILKNSNKTIKVEIDKTRFRPIDVEKIEANIDKIKNLGWNKTYNLEETIKDILNSLRK